MCTSSSSTDVLLDSSAIASHTCSGIAGCIRVSSTLARWNRTLAYALPTHCNLIGNQTTSRISGKDATWRCLPHSEHIGKISCQAANCISTPSQGECCFSKPGPSKGGAYVQGHPTASSASAAAPTAMEDTSDIDAFNHSVDYQIRIFEEEINVLKTRMEELKRSKKRQRVA
eukprot:4671004-Amphidinium_carterae.1